MASNNDDWTPVPIKAAADDWQEVPSTAPKSPSIMDRLRQGQGYIDALNNGFIKGATFGNLDLAEKGWMGKDWSQAAKDHPYVGTAGQVAGGAGVGLATGNALSAIAPVGAGAAAALGRVGVNAAGGLAQGLAQKPSEGETRLGALDPTTLRGFLNYVPGMASAAGEAAAPMLKSSANAAKSRALGINKEWPIKEGAEVNPITGEVEHADVTGLGNKLTDLGIGGNRPQMKAQMVDKMQEQEKNLLELLKGKDKVTSSEGLRDSYGSMMNRYKDPVTGTITNPDRYNSLSHEVEEDLKNTSGYSNEGLLQLKRAENGSYAQTGQLNKGQDPMIAKLKADWARSELNKADPRVPDILQNEKALSLGLKAANKPAPISKSGMSVRMLLGTALGSSFGPPGAVAGAAAGAASEVPAVQSALAKALQNSSKAVQDPELYQILAGLKNSQ